VSRWDAGWVFVSAGYLLGSIPFGLILGRRLAGVDVRQAGSGNIGATNVARTAGRKAGVATLVLDVGKGALPVAAATWFFGGAARAGDWPALTGLAAFLGHVFPAWLRFRGGKGVATAFGVFLALSPLAALAAAVAFAGALAATRIVSVASLTGSAACAVACALLHGLRSPAALAALAVLVVTVLRHRGNLRRLARGEERRL
jgi:glycerol-3-phosphate acyltransferase PlsY